MVWQFDENLPLYRQAINKLRGAILSGEYKPGEALPTVRWLSDNTGLNPNTAQRALSCLEQMGLAICYSTSGRKVTTDTEKIEKQRKIAAKEIAVTALKHAAEMGMNKEELIRYISEAE